jgi:two-component system, LytTR family, response regulator
MTGSPSTVTWRAIVVDDEPPARRALEQLLSAEADFVVVADCSHGAEAIERVREEQPDVLFLDVQMPEVDGFEVLRQLGPDTVPVVIFVTAYDRYALRAFEEHALDYLLKPFSDERFATVLDRVRARLRERTFASMAERLSGLLAGQTPSERRHLVVRDGGRTVIIPHDDIVWVEAEDYYVRIHTRDRRVLVRESLRALSDTLDASAFVRVHRSAIANVKCIREIEPLASGDQRLQLSDGTTLRVSRTHRAEVLRRVTGAKI